MGLDRKISAGTFATAVSVVLLLVLGITAKPGLHDVHAAEDDLVLATASSFQGTSILEYKNSDGNIFDIDAIVLQIKDPADFKSFKTEKGWLGKRTGPDTIEFTATEPLRPGQSVKLGIKSTIPEPEFSWTALDEEGDQIGKGEDLAIGQGQQEQQNQEEKQGNEESTQQQRQTDGQTQVDDKPQGKPDQNQGDSQKPEPPKEKPGILSDSGFRLIPDNPRTGSTLRVTGENFGPNKNLKFYIGDQEFNSIVTDESGNFVITTKIPEEMGPQRTDFAIKDNKGNEKSMSLRIKEKPEDRTEIDKTEQPLTVDPVGEVKHGQKKVIKGTATPGRTISVTLLDPSKDEDNDQLTTLSGKVNDEGAYRISHRVPVDRAPGEYKIEVSDGETTKEITYSVVSGNLIKFDSPERFDPGEELKVDVLGPPNEEVELSILAPDDREAFFEVRELDDSGKTTISIPLDQSAMEGTYTIKSRYDDKTQTYFVGVGEEPKAKIGITMDKINYNTGETAKMGITGPAGSRVNLVIVDPSGREKFSDTISVDPYGTATYDLDLDQYKSGVYTAVLTRGNTDTEKRFTVGLDVGSGPIEIRTVKDEYHRGEKVLLIGDTKPDVIVNVELLDPEGNKAKSIQAFSDRKGVFSASNLNIPTDAKPGEWTISAFSGVNHITKKIEVLATEKDELSVEIDRDPPEYENDENVFISGTAASRTSKTVVLTITNEEGEEIDELTIFSTKGGSFKTQWDIPDELSAGKYNLTADVSGEQVETSFTVK